jgi:enoyl-CoA hydratase/carnithine racemase
MKVERRGGAVELQLDRPDWHNSHDLDFAREFESAVRSLRKDDGLPVLLLLLSAAGRSFCVGGAR